MSKLCFIPQKEKPLEVIIKSSNRNSYIAKLKNPEKGYRKGFVRFKKKYWKKC